jgi:putative peptidoglycan lipid II flippase
MLITILSKILGFGREVFISYFYGATNISDAYFISLTIPVVIFSFIGTSVTTGYIPMYSSISKEINEKESYRFTNILITMILLICTILVLAVQFFTEPIVRVFASGFQGETLELAIMFTRVTILGIYFSGMIFILNGFLQIKNKFIVPALLGFVYNITIIISVYLSTRVNIIALSYGLVFSSFIQFVFLVLFIRKEGFFLKIIADFKNEYLIKFGKITLPLIFGISITQINVLVDKTLASRIAVGGISALNYADRLNSFILSTVVMSITVVVYPLMSKVVANKDITSLMKIISESVVMISILLVPSTIGAIHFSRELIDILFARGAFDANALSLTSSALMFYAIGMLGMGLREVLSRVFYSMQDTKTPVKNAALGMLINIVLNIVLSRYLGIGGLALATSIAATFTTILLFISLRKKIGPFGMKQISISFLKILFASLVMGGLAKLSFNYLTASLSQNLSLLIAIGTGAVSYFVIIYFMKIEDVDIIVGAIKKKLGRGAA